MRPALVIYHADCLDGFAAAWAAHRALGQTAILLPLHHGQVWDSELCRDREVFILDFSFSVETLSQLAHHARSVTQLDHHLSARQAWSDRLNSDGQGHEEYQHPDLPLFLRFSLEKSGARLAWEFFHVDQELPLLLQHIEDCDLWRFALPCSRAIQRSLRLLPHDLSTWDSLIMATATPSTPAYQELLVRGQAIDEFFQREIKRLLNSSLGQKAQLRGEPVDAVQVLRHGHPVVSDGNQHWHALRAVAINTDSLFCSALGHELAQQHDCPALIWQLTAGGEVHASLRSIGAIDVAAIASRYGGGGHRHAAGFRLPASHFFREVLGLEN